FHRLKTVRGGMTRTPGAPSRLIDRRSTSPSRQTAESGPATRKGGTAKVLPGMVGAACAREIIQAATAITTTAPAATDGIRQERPLGTPREGDTPASAEAISEAVANRSAGALASAFWRACATASETVSRRVRTCGIGSLNRLAMMAWAVGPLYGGSPASISYSTQPRL